MTDYSYIGSELDVFALASNWKRYYERRIAKYIGPEVLEVGAGLGSTTAALCRGGTERWVCLEPDPVLASKITLLTASGQLPRCCEVRVGTVGDLQGRETFDTVLYIDVLEHIKEDRAEVRVAAACLRDGGYLIVLSPAHQRLYSAFDIMIGHYRRYDKKSISAVVPEEVLRCRELFYLDSVGAIASLCNRYILKSAMPTRQQILFWDRVMIRLSRLFDPLFNYTIGKTLIGVWQKV